MLWVIVALLVVAAVVIFFLIKSKKTKEIVEVKETSPIEKTETRKLPNDLKLLEKDVNELKTLIKENLKKGALEFGMSMEEFEEVLFPELISQIDNAKEKLLECAKNGDYECIDEISHSVKGAALNMRLDTLGLPLQEINRAARRKEPIEDIVYYIEYFYEKYEKIK